MSDVQAFLSRVAAENREIKRSLSAVLTEYKAFRKAVEDRPKSITDELNSIPGRRIFYFFNDVLDFDVTLQGQRGQPATFRISQDGPFVMTHLPMVIWRPTTPATATNFGVWRPVTTWPLPDQVIDGDRIDLSWEFSDGGSERNFQNLPTPPMFSRPDNMVPLPVPTIFAPNTVIQFIPTFERILFDTEPQVPTTGGRIIICLPGYRIANM